MVKHELNYEMYLDLHLPRKHADLLLRLRGGLLPIEVNSGRWNRIPYDQRRCKFCNSGSIENEQHVLFQWSTFRANLINKHAEFRQPDIGKILATRKRAMIINLCNFISEVLEFRADILTVL